MLGGNFPNKSSLSSKLPKNPTELDSVFNYLIKTRGGTRKDWEYAINAIAWHETGGTMNPSIIQRSDNGRGPGEGLFQFEISQFGGSNEARTAVNRAVNFYKSQNQPVPGWIKDLYNSTGEIHFGKLPAEKQTQLFLINGIMKPGKIGMLLQGPEGISNYWVNHHWSGSSELKDSELEKFTASLQTYQQNR